MVICMTTLKRRSLKKFDFLDKTSNMVGAVWGRGGKALEEGDSYEIWGRGGVGGGGGLPSWVGVHMVLVFGKTIGWVGKPLVIVLGL